MSPGWLKKQLEQAVAEVASWPLWKRREAGIDHIFPEIALYFVYWEDPSSREAGLEAFTDQIKAETFLNSDKNRVYRVIVGREAKAEKVETVTRYEIKK